MGGGGFGQPPIEKAEQLAERVAPEAARTVNVINAPMMHGGGQWPSFIVLFGGGTVVVNCERHFDGASVWRMVERERATSIMVVGDAMARPLADALAAPGASYDLSSLLSVGSGGALFSPAVKEDLKRLLPHVILAESLGSSESGLDAVTFLEDRDLEAGARARFALGPHLGVFDDDLRPVAPGSGAVGRLARRGHIPVGYHNDPARTAATFPVIDGERWVMPGDHALVDADGTVHLLGRGSVCINTGGEKVWAEEVEAVLKRHPAVYDAVVVGVPDPRWGQQVAAAVQLRAGRQIADDDELARHCRSFLAGYKVPRRVRVVDEVVRHPSGKPDYRWAASVAVPALT
jgi:acyl-CoA synthetase (AMP-forming)/AMP-acid ligase II